MAKSQKPSVLSSDWERPKPHYDFIIVGSGYGGAIKAARLATANLNPKRAPIGQFPDLKGGVRSHPGGRIWIFFETSQRA